MTSASWTSALRRLCAAVMIACTALPGLQGCVSWPKEARGGLAEREFSGDPVLVELRRAFRRLADEGALKTRPALMLEAQLLMIRAHREYAGGLRPDYWDTARAAWAAMARVNPSIGYLDATPAPRRDDRKPTQEEIFQDG